MQSPMAAFVGRILSVKVTSDVEKEYYSALTDKPARIFARQGVKVLGVVICAKITSEAIMIARIKPLAPGMK